MTRILSLDTTAEFGSLALVEDGRLVEELPLHSPDGFGHILFPHLERLLARHGWNLGGVDCFAAAAGPGSFTGVRVGLSAVKGLAEAAGQPIVPVSTLRAVAWFGSRPLRATLLDARRGEIYGAVYNADLDLVCAETVGRFGDWLETLPPDDVELLSTNLAPFRTALAGTRFANAPTTETPRALAEAIGCVASRDFGAGRALGAASVDANYVRRSDAELRWKDIIA